MAKDPSPVNFELLRTNMRAAMARMGWNASKLADVCGVPQPTISRFLNRSTDSLRLDNLQMIAHCLKTSVGALLGEIPLENNIHHARVAKAISVMSDDRLAVLAEIAAIFASLDGDDKNSKVRAAPSNVSPLPKSRR